MDVFITSIDCSDQSKCNDLTIPPTIGQDNLPVVAIFNQGYDSFQVSGSLTISNKLEQIGSSTFNHLKDLRTLNIPEDSVLSIIDGSAFSNSNLSGNIQLPSTITYLGAGAFSNTHISSLTIPEESTITVLPNYLCSENRNLEYLSFPSSVTTIELEAFFRTGLKSLTFPENSRLETIGDAAFSVCNSLTGTLSFPIGVTSIGLNAFSYCNLTEIIFDEEAAIYILNESFPNNIYLATIHLPKAITEISGTFNGCGIESFVWSDYPMLYSIRNEAFLGTKSVENYQSQDML